MAAEYYRAVQAQKTIREAQWRELCGLLPDGADSYRFVPARCVPKVPRGARQVREPKNRAEAAIDAEVSVTRRLLERQRDALLRELPELRRARDEFIRRLRAANRPPIAVPQVNANMHDVYEELLSIQPLFIVRACRDIMDADYVRRYPDVSRRYVHIAREFDEEHMFVDDVSVKCSVFELALDQINAVLQL